MLTAIRRGTQRTAQGKTPDRLMFPWAVNHEPTLLHCREADMRTLNPDYVNAVAGVANASPYFRLLSMEIRSLGWGESLLEIRVQEKHLQPFGIVHGGVCSSLVDAAAFWAVYSQLQPGQGMTTVDLKLNFLAPSSAGRLIARGRCLRLGKTLGLGEASVEDERGNLLAHGTSTTMILGNLNIQGESGLPPKFLDHEPSPT
jgi:uncharacterized protein (TIGR00369 family)